VGGGVGYFYFIIKGKITLSFASPEKEKLYIYIYDVITWRIFYKYSEHNYCGDLPRRRPLARLTALKMMKMPFICSFRNIMSTVRACQRPGRLAYIIISGLGLWRGWQGLVACRGMKCQYGS
jgi:hypothetical protein